MQSYEKSKGKEKHRISVNISVICDALELQLKKIEMIKWRGMSSTRA